MMDSRTRETILAQQWMDWPKHLAGAREGNPWAMLCDHCYGRHLPPRGVICQNDPPLRDPVADRLDRRADPG